VAGRLNYARGHLLYNQGDGDLKTARPHLDKSVQQLQRASMLAPGDGRIVLDLMDTRLTDADVISHAGQYRQAQTIAEAELARLARQPPSVLALERAPTLAAKAEEILGNAHYYQGRKAEALAAYRRGVALTEGENAQRPGRSATVSRLLALLVERGHDAGRAGEQGRSPALAGSRGSRSAACAVPSIPSTTCWRASPRRS
jgi:tetratricopeptide (TPR) repeat protein